MVESFDGKESADLHHRGQYQAYYYKIKNMVLLNLHNLNPPKTSFGCVAGRPLISSTISASIQQISGMMQKLPIQIADSAN